ncbi:MAG TPA: proline--tRNA ligase [Actinomycetota bacterium]|nr:proline--tRNA ligase [Actinomycetota bacterium]
MALPKQDANFPGWYQEVVKTAELAEPSLARGTMVIRPYGYAIWEAIQRALDDRIKATGHQNLYFPLFIPYRLLEKEAEHVEGFAPEVAVVTHAGGEKLEEPLVIRPTSETVIWDTYSRWIQSYRDLPLLYNQWANVVRWELRPRLFLRTTEFLWQEGHTAHETEKEAREETLRILHEVYLDAVEKVLAIPAHAGRKSASERFAGAVETYTLEALMRDRKALQAGTSHYLGQNFAKAYGVQFQNRKGTLEHAFATSWGVSTRLVGAVIMAHGDDRGLRLPPALAPIEVVVVPVYRTDDERGRVLKASHDVARELAGHRVRVDDRDDVRPGFKFNEWELRGVPVRVELGPRDLDANMATVVPRLTGTKEQVALSELGDRLLAVLAQAQKGLFDEARTFRDKHTFRPKDMSEMSRLLDDPGGFMLAGWCGSEECEAKVKAETKATIRFLPLEPTPPSGPCIVCGQPATDEAAWALAY